MSWAPATASPERRLLEVTANERLGAYRLVKVLDPGGDCAPGQFAMLAAEQRWGGGQDERPFLARAGRDGEPEVLCLQELHREPREPGEHPSTAGSVSRGAGVA